MIHFVFNHPYIFSTISVLFLCGVIIIIYEIRRAIKSPDDYEEE